MDRKALKQTAYQRRLEVLEMVHRTGSGHIGGDMSCMDALVTLYYAGHRAHLRRLQRTSGSRADDLCALLHRRRERHPQNVCGRGHL